MKHKAYTSVHPLEGIQTANKNIYSYFMKSDNSYYMPAEDRYPNYKKESDETYIVVITEYRTKDNDHRYKHNGNGIEIECIMGKEKNNVQKKRIDLSNIMQSIREVEREVPNGCAKSASEMFIALVYPDGINRVSIMCMIDSVIKHSGCKGILVIPYALSVTLGMALSNAVVVNKTNESVVCIEDNCVVSEGYMKHMPATNTMYGDDIVEEFVKKEDVTATKTEIVENICYMCNMAYDLADFSAHYKKHHNINVYDDIKGADKILSRCSVRVRVEGEEHNNSGENKNGHINNEQNKEEENSANTAAHNSDVNNTGTSDSLTTALSQVYESIQPQERQKKIFAATIYITEDGAGAEDTQHDETDTQQEGDKETDKEGEKECVTVHITKEKAKTTAWKGMYALLSTEPSKDLWMTDKEWKNLGLRILKEKVLFNI